MYKKLEELEEVFYTLRIIFNTDNLSRKYPKKLKKHIEDIENFIKDPLKYEIQYHMNIIKIQSHLADENKNLEKYDIDLS